MKNSLILKVFAQARRVSGAAYLVTARPLPSGWRKPQQGFLTIVRGSAQLHVYACAMPSSIAIGSERNPSVHSPSKTDV